MTFENKQAAPKITWVGEIIDNPKSGDYSLLKGDRLKRDIPIWSGASHVTKKKTKHKG